MTKTIGHTCWAIAEGHIPGRSNGPEPQMTSHETACILNAGDRTARVRITLYFANREPVGPYEVEVPARRTRHLRFNDLENPAPVPRDTTTPASSKPTCPSWCSIAGSIHDRANWRC